MPCTICEGEHSLLLSVLFPLSAISRPSRVMSLLVTKSPRQECQVRVPMGLYLGFSPGRCLEKANPRSPASEYCWWCKEATDFLRLWKDCLLLEGCLRATGHPCDQRGPFLPSSYSLTETQVCQGLLCTGEGFQAGVSL